MKPLRLQAVENHRKWVEAAKTLGCVTIRVNAASAGTFEEQQKLAADGLRRLTEIGASAWRSTWSWRTTAACRRTASGSPA